MWPLSGLTFFFLVFSWVIFLTYQLFFYFYSFLGFKNITISKWRLTTWEQPTAGSVSGSSWFLVRTQIQVSKEIQTLASHHQIKLHLNPHISNCFFFIFTMVRYYHDVFTTDLSSVANPISLSHCCDI